jgi:hypothetical protein
MDLGWNKKRGTGPHSIDALAWRHDGIVDVVDFALAYDATDRPMRLQWLVLNPNGGPGYDGYSPMPVCQ